MVNSLGFQKDLSFLLLHWTNKFPSAPPPTQGVEGPHLLVSWRLCWLLAGDLRLQLCLGLVQVGESKGSVRTLHGTGVYGIWVT